MLDQNKNDHLAYSTSNSSAGNSWLTHLLARVDESIVFRLVAAIAFVGAVWLLVTRTGHVLNIPGDPLHSNWGLQDFRDAVYYPVVSLLAGDNPYNSAHYMSHYPVGQHFPPYSPLVMVLHSGFTLTDLPTAGWIYFGCVLVLYLGLVHLSLRYCDLPSTWAIIALITAVLLISRPGYMNITIGQVGAQLSIATLIAVHYARSRPWVSALAIAFVSIKVTWFVPLLILLWARGDRTACVRGIAIAVVATAGPLIWLLTSVDGPSSLLQALPDNVAVFKAQSDALSNFTRIDLASLVKRLTHGRLPAGHQHVVTVITLAFVAWRVVLWRRRIETIAEANSARIDRAGIQSPDSLLIVLTVLACTYHQPYDLVMLVPIVLVTLSQIDGSSSTVTGQTSRWFTVSSVLLLVFLSGLGLNFLSSHGVLPGMIERYPDAADLFKSLNGILMMAVLLSALWRLATTGLVYPSQTATG